MPSPRVSSFSQQRKLVVSCLLVLLCFLLAGVDPIASAQEEPCNWCPNEPPVADVSGPYNSAPGTGVQFSGLASYDGDGWITSYFWDFGDGTTGTGPQPTHTYQAEGIYTIRLTVTDNNGASTSTETTVTVNAQTVRINFDNLPSGTIVTNQYEQVKFSATWFSGGLGGPTGYDIYTQPNYGSGGSTPNAIFSNYYPSWNNPMYARGAGNFYLDFPVPVNDFSFLMLNIFNPSYVCYADVYVNRAFYGTFYIYGAPGHGKPFVVNTLKGIPGITSIALYSFSNYEEGYWRPVYLDDFTFTPDLTVNITNGRINGILNGSTQKALVGADIALNAIVLPAGRTGGTYSWTFTGPHVVLSPANSASVTIRSTDTGTITANVTYTLNGASASTSVNINAVLPTLTQFTGQEVAERVAAGNTCGEDAPLGTFYVLGCPESLQGMTFSAAAKVPEGTYLSDPAQSGI